MAHTFAVLACLALICLPSVARAQPSVCDKNKVPDKVINTGFPIKGSEDRGDFILYELEWASFPNGPTYGCVDTYVLETYDENGTQVSTQNIKIVPPTDKRFYTSVLQPAGTTRTYKVSALNSQQGLKSNPITLTEINAKGARTPSPTPVAGRQGDAPRTPPAQLG